MNGKLIEIKKIEDKQTRIGMVNLVCGNYLLKVIVENKEVKVFKIIKN
jgi:hypothetical protein